MIRYSYLTRTLHLEQLKPSYRQLLYHQNYRSLNTCTLFLNTSKVPKNNDDDSNSEAASGNSSGKKKISLADLGKDSEASSESSNTNSSKINIYQSKSDLIESSKIEHFIKKKSLGLTDDESTATGKVKARAKDTLALVATALAGWVVAYSMWKMYSTYFKKLPQDYCFELATEIQKNSNELVDHIGVDYTIEKHQKGEKVWGNKVIAQLDKDEKLNYDTCIVINYIDTDTGRKIMCTSHFVKKPSESDKLWFPSICLVTLDYKNTYYNKKVFLVDNRKEIQSGKDLTILRETIKQTDEQKKIAMDEYKQTQELKKQLAKEEAESELFSALGGIGEDDNKRAGMNFVKDDKKIGGDKVETGRETLEEAPRLRPKF